jgi:tetratricopeptide (TPR) repeat protein
MASDVKRTAQSGGTHRAKAAAPATLPAAVGKYHVLSRIGAGAMGVVYKCAQPGLDRPVAVKVLLASAHANAGQIERFQREARAAARLTHPNIVHVYDVGQDGELFFFVMEYVGGGSLDRLIGTPNLSIERSLRLVYPVASALQTAHERGIVHRDIKPSNILLTPSGQPKIADFGLAKSLDDGQSLSGTGDLIGTPRYMSPEQVLSPTKELDARTDVYSLGAVLYEMLTGRPPVDGPTALAVIRQISDEEPVPVRERNPEVPVEVEAICLKALARDRNERFATAGQFADAIQGYLLAKYLVRNDSGGSSQNALPIVTAPRRLALPSSPARSRRHWVGTMIVGVLVVAAAIGVATFLHGLARNAPPTDAALSIEEQQVLARVRDLLHDPSATPPGTPPRDVFPPLLEDLDGVIRRHPDLDEAHLLRAHVNRRAGEYLSAIDETTPLLRRDPENVDAATERLLAVYQFYVLSLGNLNEPFLRPYRHERMMDDLALLARRGDDSRRRLADLVGALARQDYSEAGRIAVASAEATSDVDATMLEADALLHVADAAHDEINGADTDDKKDRARLRFDQLARKAEEKLRRGLAADPHHLGLLFLDAHAIQRRTVWEVSDKEDQKATSHRLRPAFETSLNRLRDAALDRGGETAVAKAVLLDNFGREDAALALIDDALRRRPDLAPLHVVKAWLRFHSPPDGILSGDEAERILADLQPIFETPPQDFTPYFVRALLHAAAGNWEEARRDVQQCRRQRGSDDLPTGVGGYAAWFNQANASTTEFLDATLTLLDSLNVPADLRIRLAEKLLARLADSAVIAQDKVDPERHKAMGAWSHFRLAKALAEKGDKTPVFDHARKALAVKLTDLTPQVFRDDGAFAAWKDDPDFTKLLAEFETP